MQYHAFHPDVATGACSQLQCLSPWLLHDTDRVLKRSRKSKGGRVAVLVNKNCCIPGQSTVKNCFCTLDTEELSTKRVHRCYFSHSVHPTICFCWCWVWHHQLSYQGSDTTSQLISGNIRDFQHASLCHMSSFSTVCQTAPPKNINHLQICFMQVSEMHQSHGRPQYNLSLLHLYAHRSETTCDQKDCEETDTGSWRNSAEVYWGNKLGCTLVSQVELTSAPWLSMSLTI